MSRSRRDSKRRNISRYRKPLNINIGTIVFGIIFLYLAVCIYAYMTSSHITPYEVQAGSIVVDSTCEGLILRDEQVVSAEGDGYITYYVQAGDRVAVTSSVYTLDSSGHVLESLEASYGADIQLSSEDLNRLQATIENFSSRFSPSDFQQVYSFKSELDGASLALYNEKLLEAASAQSADASGSFQFFSAAAPGIIEYYVDGYEDVGLDSFTSGMFDSASYEKTDLKAREIVNAGDPAYKLLTDETWHIVFPMENDWQQQLAETTSLDVRFVDNGLEAPADFQIISRDGKAYGALTLHNYMVDFSGERYVEIELLLNQVEGLKIPVSAVTQKQFYTIPEEFLTSGGDEGAEGSGFLRETYMEDGTATVEFVGTTIYETADGLCYVDCDDFQIGDYIVKPDSQEERFQIGATQTLKGVYNINRGYAVFRKIHVLYETEDYCIVEEGTDFGLSIYDHIVLDSSSVQEEEIVY